MGNEIPLAEVFRRAAALVGSVYTWTQFAAARTKSTARTVYYSATAVSFSVDGALDRAVADLMTEGEMANLRVTGRLPARAQTAQAQARYRTEDLLADRPDWAKYGSLARWQDSESRCHDDIIQLLTEMEARCRTGKSSPPSSSPTIIESSSSSQST